VAGAEEDYAAAAERGHAAEDIMSVIKGVDTERFR
jgi:hypothetical protein